MASGSRKRGRPDGVELDGALLRQRRGRLGLSQSGVADLARLGVRTVRSAEQGQPVSPDTAKLLASSLGLAYIELLRPPADLIRSQLLSHGFAAIDPPDGLLPVSQDGALRTALVDPDTPLIVVHGPLGVGKSSLVQRGVGDLHAQFPDGVVWVAAGRLMTRELLDASRLELAECLGFRNRLPDPAVVSPTAFDHAFQSHFWRWPRLLVLDNVEDPDIVRAMVGEATGKVLVTTRARWVAEQLGGRAIEVSPWPDDAVITLLSDAVGQERLDRDPSGLKELLELIGGLPLNAQLAATGLQRMRRQTMGDYVARIRAGLSDPSMAARGADPLAQGLMAGLGSVLPTGALDAVRALSIAGDSAFGNGFAEVAVGGRPASVRALLDALFDAYVLRETDPGVPGSTMRLEDWARGAWGAASPDAVDRVVQWAPARIDALITDPRHDLAARALTAALPEVRVLLRACIAQFEGPVHPARGPDDLPPVPSSTAVDVLPGVVRSLLPLYRLAPTMEGGVWASAAIAVARERGTTAQQVELAWLLAWWWYLRGDDLQVAFVWADQAARLVDAEDQPDLAISLTMHAGMLERAHSGITEAKPRYERALRLSDELGSSASQRCAAAMTYASCLIFAVDPPRWSEALELLDGAYALSEGDEDSTFTMLRAATAVSRSVVRGALGVDVDLDELSEAIRTIDGMLGGDGLLRVAGFGLVETLGGSPEERVHTAREVFLEQDENHSEATIQQLMELCVQLGATNLDRPDDSRRDTPLGHLAPWVISSFPIGNRPGLAFDVILPVKPLAELFEGEGVQHAQRFVRAVRGDDHPLHAALDQLAG